MARAVNRLTTREVETLSEAGRHADGGNLYLSISANGGRRWVFLYRWDGKQREMGLGSAAKGGVSLADARKLAKTARDHLAAGLDPIKARDEGRSKQGRVVPTFGEFADGYIKTHRPKFRNSKHAAQWESTLGDAYCKAIRSTPVSEIGTEAVLKVLQPIWQSIPETASRIRGRIENVLDAAKARGFRDGQNPAQ